MKYPLNYPDFPDLKLLQEQLLEYARLKYEMGADREKLQGVLDRAAHAIRSLIDEAKGLDIDPVLARQEPDSLDAIRSLRPDGPRRLWKDFNKDKYIERLMGAFVGRMAGCTLGAPVEFWSVEAMADWAGYIGDPFPPVDY
ncbi:MAG TPA: ADP-ribosylglycohydrolase family protein [Candidatus Atribacteria bacterium]|nr:ADP-ribosylglycohydrolase family protein [Candidatus Atribacteria bacterium]